SSVPGAIDVPPPRVNPTVRAKGASVPRGRRKAVAMRTLPPYDPPPMTSLDRYILRQCLSMMIFVTVALSAAVWLAQSLRLVDLIVNRGLSIDLFIYLALLILPRFLNIVVPIGAFIAVLFVFNRLTSESELVVMRAAGLGPLVLARPVFILAGLGFVAMMSLSAYFLPASNREFKDLQFEIRNRFVSALLQEGAFTTVSDKLTIYIGGRNERGEVTGLLINDDRDPQQPVTILAERGAFADADRAQGSRIIMVNGSRQRFDRATGKLSILTFDRYTLDLDMLRDAPVVRFRDAQERFLSELFWPPPDLDPLSRASFRNEGHQRLAVPLSVFSFVMIPLACLLPGEFNRRGQLNRVLVAIGLAFVFQAVDLAIKNLAIRHVVAIPLMYLTDLLPLALGFGILLFGGIKLDFRRLLPATR
ncbi:MAG TPA: LPS export ABC transporter permease LptF, partial [Bradyrhizobium sp.]|nr:LPS export ABC transporter permease LptF [Bradyrhizobium sp.]